MYSTDDNKSFCCNTLAGFDSIKITSVRFIFNIMILYKPLKKRPARTSN